MLGTTWAVQNRGHRNSLYWAGAENLSDGVDVVFSCVVLGDGVVGPNSSSRCNVGQIIWASSSQWECWSLGSVTWAAAAHQ